MSNTIIELRHSYVTGNVPSSLANGEIAINTYDGKLFYRGGPSNTVQTIERYQGPAGLNGEIQFNDSGVLGSASNLTFDKLTGLFRTGNVTANTVATRDYIQFGDGSRQYTANAGSGGGGSDQWVRDVANASFIRANNSIDANNGGTATGNISILANLTASNIATQTYIQFGDGTKQYTANAGSGGGGGTIDTYARNHSNSAFEKANSIIAVSGIFDYGLIVEPSNYTAYDYGLL